MADHGAIQDDQPRSRHPSPYSDISDVRHESLKAPSSGQQPGGSPHARRRPSRTLSGAKDSMRSVSPYEDVRKGRGKKSKRDKSTSRKITRIDSFIDNTSALPQSGELEMDWDENTGAYIPRLGQILEGKESKPLQNHTGSAVSSTVDSRMRRRLRGEESATGRLRVRDKQNTTQRRLEGLSNLSNPSLASSSSRSTQRSYAPTGSNSTVTQDSYDRPYVRERVLVNESADIITTCEVEPAKPDVFQYLNQDFAPEEFESGASYIVQPNASSSSSSSGDSRTQDGLSSNAGENEQMNDSPATSPALTRKSNSDVSHHHHRRRQPRNPKVPLYASSFVHGHGDQRESLEEKEDDDDEGDEPSEKEIRGEHGTNVYSVDTDHAHNSSSIAPPRTSSASSQESDLHARRLRQQEQDLANHIHQTPSSRKKSRRHVVPSPAPYPSVPYYDPYSPTGASPSSLQTAGQPWSPMPYIPPPLQIGQSPHSPESVHGFAVALQPPMVAPEVPDPQSTPAYHQPAGYTQQYPPYAPGPDLSKTTVVGYELLADKLSNPSKGSSDHPRAGHLVPLYRKFENLNHRVLLHLQDEISELEEELRYLDECIAQTSYKDESGHAHPASRRGDARYGNGLVYKRTELLGRIFQKLGQYNQALSSFGNVTNNLEPASAENVQSYRRWMDKRAPIDQTESRFLEHKDDLLAVSRTKPVKATGEQGHSTAVWLPLVLMLPLMAFAIVPNLLGRLFVLLLIGASGLKLITSTPELMNFMTVQEWTGIASIYFGTMALLAAFVH